METVSCPGNDDDSPESAVLECIRMLIVTVAQMDENIHIEEQSTSELVSEPQQPAVSGVTEQNDDALIANSRKRRAMMGVRGFLNQSDESVKSVVSVESDTQRKRFKRQKDIDRTDEVFRECDAFKAGIVEYGFRLGLTQNNYVTSCKWSSESRYLVTSSQDRNARIFELDENNKKIALKTIITSGALLYDICWHPHQKWLATTGKDNSICIVDINGVEVATCRGHDHFDEVVGAYSTCFSLNGNCLCAGYNRNIKLFDMRRPRDPSREIKTWKKNVGGQKGIISCLSFNPIMADIFAAGSYDKSIGLYAYLSPEPICTFTCPSAVTVLKYSSNGNLLYSAGRKDDKLYAWDLRKPGSCLATYCRPSSTNQRVYFDVDSYERKLISGSTSGDFCVFDLTMSGDGCLPVRTVHAHHAACVGVSVNKRFSLLATCSGQRVYPFPECGGEENVELTNEDNLVESEYENIWLVEDLDNSLALWKL